MVEGTGLENRRMHPLPWVRIPLSPPCWLTRTLGSRCATEVILYLIKPLHSPDLKGSPFIFPYLIFLSFLSDGVCLEFYSMLY